MTNCKRIYLIVFFSKIFIVNIFSQSLNSDSIINIFNSSTSDTDKVNKFCSFNKDFLCDHPEMAVLAGFQCLELAQQINYKKGIGACYNNLGIVYSCTGNYSLSFDYLIKSLGIAEELEDTFAIAKAYNNIGNVLKTKGDYTLSLSYYKKSLNLKYKLKDKKGISNCCINIGSIYYYLNNFPEALKYYSVSLEIEEGLSHEIGISICYNNIGTVFSAQKNFDEALKYYNRSLQIEKKYASKERLSMCYCNIADAYIGLQSYNKAKENAEEALSIAKEINALEWIKNAYYNLSVIYDSMGIPSKSLAYFRSYIVARDSLLNMEQKTKISELEIKYKTEIREKEIAVLQKEKSLKESELNRQKNIKYFFVFSGILFLLISLSLFALFNQKRKSNKILTSINQKLNESETNLIKLNNIKNQFFSIISHDLRSPLDSLRTSLVIYLANSKTFTQEELNLFLNSILHSVDQTRNLFENLINWSKSETNQINLHPSDFCLDEIIQETLELFNMKIRNKNITIKTDIKKETYISADKNTIKFVIRNLLDNAIKFTHQNGTIVIETFEENDYFKVTFSDNGIGIPKENLIKLEEGDNYLSTAGTDNEKGVGLGLKLCKEFIKLNKGTFTIESEFNVGSKFSFTIPLAY